MPANLTQQYLKAEQEYRRATTPDEELACLQVMLSEIPKHKGTDHLQAQIKSKISKLKKEITSDKKSGKKSRGIRIPRQGAGSVILLGGPNAGKSQIITTLTHATPEVAPYPFTTTTPAPAMMPWEDVAVQLIDTPPITADYMESHLHGLTRAADLVLLVLDLGNDDGVEQCQEVLDRLSTTKTRLGATSGIDENDVGLSYTQTFLIANKIDDPDATERLELFHELCPLDFREFAVSAQEGTGMEELRTEIYLAMDQVRVYTKLPSSKEADFERPFTLRRGSTLLDMARLIHKDYVNDLKFARIWGEAVHDGTQVKGNYVLHDKDVVEIHAS